MRGKVFIGWTMSETLAICVKNELRKHDFYGICGGREGSNEILAGIGATVVNQMNKCSSAIMLFSKRDEQIRDVNGNMVLTKTLSPNMLYELGYLSGSLNLKRVMGVYLDGAEDLVPTDIKGGWQETISTDGKTNEEIAKEIVDKFLKGQFNLVNGNKMDLMTDISKLRTIIKDHIKKPMYYDDEIAYIVLLLCQASYMHDERPTDKSLIEELYNADISDKKCLLAINSTIDYFFACDSLVEIEFNGGMQLPPKAYKKLKKNLLEYVDEAEELEDGQFKYMFLMIAYDYLTFINMMYYAGVDKEDLDDEIIEFREEMALKSIEYARKFIDYDEKDNFEIAQLYLSYTFRNLAIFYRNMGWHDKAQERFEESISARKSLYKYFGLKNLNKSINEQIKMEYYLSLKDNLPDVNDDLKRKRIRELKEYIEEVNEVAFNRKHLTSEIERVLLEVSKNMNK